MKPFKPQLACDWEQDKLKFPVGIMPKIDGVRGMKPEGRLVGRSLKPFANLHLGQLFSASCFDGYDGELAVGEETDSDLCRRTTAATSTIKGEYIWTWHVFDLCASSVANLGFQQRYDMMKAHVDAEHEAGRLLDLKVVPLEIVETMEELLEWENTWLEMGYEGVIIRRLDGRLKSGRSTPKEGYYLRIKRFTDGEGQVVRIIEGQTNNNEARINELGYTYRSTHMDNMSPNGMIGSYVVKVLTVPQGLENLITVGQEMTVSAGKLTHEERKYYFDNPNEFIGRITKYKFFAHGMKDKLRIPTHQSFRDPVDMSE